MGIAEPIKRLFEKSDQVRIFEERSTVGIFLWLLAGTVSVIGIVGKILDLDKPIALWLSHALTTDQATKAPALKLWFVPFIFLALFVVVALILMIIWTVKSKYVQTGDQIALNEIMGSVRKIRDQAAQTKRKAWESVTFVYLINKDFSGSLTLISVIKSVDLPVHFWESVTAAEDDADSANSLAAINYRVRDLSSTQSNIVYLPSENAKRSKSACLFFLPPIQPGESRKFEISYQWPGLFRKLKNDSEEFEFTSSTRDVLSVYRLELYLQEGTRGALDCEISGDQHTTQTLTEAKHEANGWRGHGYVYEVKDIPAGELSLVLKAKLKN